MRARHEAQRPGKTALLLLLTLLLLLPRGREVRAVHVHVEEYTSAGATGEGQQELEEEPESMLGQSCMQLPLEDRPKCVARLLHAHSRPPDPSPHAAPSPSHAC